MSTRGVNLPTQHISVPKRGSLWRGGVVKCSKQAQEPRSEVSQVEITPEIRTKLAVYGFVEEEDNLKALQLSGGDVKKAIKILSSDAADEWGAERRDVEELMEKGG
eukprot:CAMPEP_0184488412 /NCGR_PEP_ID=MMETSP0113_2-20130426/11759_1 /TAXON_ID=91329 /ORGANISM="Norrisiella sphaerica, Strain BC52" /LENGTH=105 /DNA_ID=CAMNT_0026871163 /DNA_START=180 /DNA_END=497 /DNA_ORIENTATION=-